MSIGSGCESNKGGTSVSSTNQKNHTKLTDEVPEDDPESQGLLEEEAPFPDVSAEFLGVPVGRRGGCPGCNQ
jgi:hypothetical protein